MRTLSLLQLLLWVCCGARTYTKYPKKDHGGDTIGDQMIPFTEEGMRAKCDDTVGCCGFNSWGYMKSACTPLDPMTNNPDFWIVVVPPADTGSSGLSGGSIFCIAFVVFLVVYCIGGAVFNTTTKGTTGVESIPNVELWRSLPGNVKAGIAFTKSKIAGTPVTPPSYDSVA